MAHHLQAAAEALAASIGAAKNGVTVLAWYGPPEQIVVWYDAARGLRLAAPVPDSFAGFKVRTEPHPSVVAS